MDWRVGDEKDRDLGKWVIWQHRKRGKCKILLLAKPQCFKVERVKLKVYAVLTALAQKDLESERVKVSLSLSLLLFFIHISNPKG